MQKYLSLLLIFVLFGCLSPEETASTNKVSEKESIGSVEASTEPTTDCPFGRVNDPYPGACGRYVDDNGNEICDYSE